MFNNVTKVSLLLLITVLFMTGVMFFRYKSNNSIDSTNIITIVSDDIPLADAVSNGDVNGDGKISSQDYILVKKHIINLSTLTGDNYKRADVNGDGKISSQDYILIKKIILNQVTITPAPTPTATPTPKPTPKPTPTPVPNITCQPGYFKHYYNDTKCEICEKGSYCPGGTFKMDDSNVGIVNCPGRFFYGEKGAKKVEDCVMTILLYMYYNDNQNHYFDVNYNGTYSNLPTITMSGYTFAGWYSDKNYNNRVLPSDKVSGDYNVLRAKWVRNNSNEAQYPKCSCKPKKYYTRDAYSGANCKVYGYYYNTLEECKAKISNQPNCACSWSQECSC